ncbi:MAG: hypothetical protein FWH47_05010 [Methanomassiliicoccaceae archaeon]|nr:hypothetical protein [Methanomassiliicoccaceae archaeon]
MNEPESMREIHEIRERIYEERKGMSHEEYNAEVRRNTDALLEESGHKLIPVEGRPGIYRMVRA